jgi:hypothetical protein
MGRTRSLGFVLSLGIVSGTACRPSSHKPDPPDLDTTFEGAIRMMCNVDQLARIEPTASQSEKDRIRYHWLNDHIHNEDGIYFRTMWRGKPPAEQVQMLRAEAGRLYWPCPMADTLEREAKHSQVGGRQ